MNFKTYFDQNIALYVELILDMILWKLKIYQKPVLSLEDDGVDTKKFLQG
jgi:hypothetical protein